MWMLLLCLVVGILLNTASACQDEEVEHKGRCYYFGGLAQNPLSARDICKGRGGQLASINDADENDFLASQAHYHISSAWATWLFAIGGFKEAGKWVWSDGSPISSYTNWGPGEPNPPENCMVLMRPAGFLTKWQWYSINCDSPDQRFICERSNSDGIPFGK